MNENNELVLYPSNWLYNAAVIGFLKSLVGDTKDNQIENYFYESGEVKISKQIFNELDVLKRYFSESKKENIASIVGNSGTYRNFINGSRKQDQYSFPAFVKELSHLEPIGNTCGFCNSKNFFPKGSRERLSASWLSSTQKSELEKTAKKKESMKKTSKNQKPKTINGEEEFCKFLESISSFSNRLNNMIGPSESFPNSYWNNKSTVSVCPLCAYLIIHSHIPFIKSVEGEIFINAPSFKLMWYLNKYAGEVFNRENVRDILAMSFMDFSQKVNATLGMWSTANIEVIIKKRGGGIDHYALPYDQTRLLLNRNISSLISKTKEPNILDMVLSGRFGDLVKLNEKLLKSVFSNNAEDGKNYLRNYQNHNIRRIKSITTILPELYIHINKQLQEEVI